MAKVIDKLEAKIVEMEFPSFYVYDFITGKKEKMPLNQSRNFVRSLAIAVYYNADLIPLEASVFRAALYSFYSKCEYEHWENDTKIEEDGYFEQFIRWAYADENAKYYDVRKGNEPQGLIKFLENHPLRKMWEKEIRRIRKVEEKRQNRNGKN